MNSRLKLVKPNVKNRAVAPTRLANSKYRSREHLTPSEVEKLVEAAKTNRYGHRDATMLLVAYRHGLRVSELPSFANSNGRKSILMAQPCMCVGPRMASQLRIPSGATKSVHCASSNVKLLSQHSYLLMSGEHRSHPTASIGW